MAQRHAPIGVHNTRECLALVELYQSCHKKHILSFNACLEERKVMEACLYLEVRTDVWILDKKRVGFAYLYIVAKLF